MDRIVGGKHQIQRKYPFWRFSFQELNKRISKKKKSQQQKIKPTQ